MSKSKTSSKGQRQSLTLSDGKSKSMSEGKSKNV